MKQLIFTVILLAGLFGCGSSNEEKEIIDEDVIQDSIEAYQQENPSPEIIKEVFYEAFEDCKSFEKKTHKYNNTEELKAALLVCELWVLSVEKAKKLADQSLNKDIKAFEALITKIQKKQFPIWRKKYMEFKSQELFRYNIEVRRGGGSSYNTIEFISYDFANNAVIEDCNSLIWDELNRFRFKKVNYRWSEYDSRYTYYNIKSPSDSKIVP